MLFKKQICFFLAFFLLLSQMGWSFNIHFCDNKVASVSINSTSNSFEIEKKCCGEVEKDAKCCHNKIVKATEKQDAFYTKSISFSPEFTFLLSNWKPLVFLKKKTSDKKIVLSYYCDANAPPIYKLNCQLVFYA